MLTSNISSYHYNIDYFFAKDYCASKVVKMHHCNMTYLTFYPEYLQI